MKTLVFSACAVVVTLSSGCGSTCTRVAAAEEAIYTKGKACGTLDGSWTKSKTESCEAKLPKCSADNVKRYESYADCLQKIPACTENQAISYNAARLECLGQFNGLDSSCVF
jgi:uncharacterized protein YceK